MAEAEFEYNGTKTIIQCNIEDKLSIIADKFLFKCKKIETMFIFSITDKY